MIFHWTPHFGIADLPQRSIKRHTIDTKHSNLQHR